MKDSYDLIIIGGGATGSGIALDASIRGYSTLLIEADDFASKSSSNSTKLVHGGVRYLEKAVCQLNKSQFDLVTEALEERYYFLSNAKNLTHRIKLFSPVYSLFERLYIYVGLKLYDFLSFSKSIGKSEFIDALTSRLIHPQLKQNINGSVSFYDGGFHDSKMVISLLQTAQQHGCEVKNYHEVRGFIYQNNHIEEVKIFDKLERRTYQIKGKVIINATGYYCDKIRQMDDENAKPLLTYSRGSHIVIDTKHFPQKEALFFSKTSDNRVIFILPWHDAVLIGTTEVGCDFEEKPLITKEEIDYLLENVNTQLNLNLTRKDIRSSFSGIRPLIQNPDINESAELVREHLIIKDASNLVSITGGKWTTYRKMAQDCLDFIIKHNLIESKKICETKNFRLQGNEKQVFHDDLKEYNLDANTKEHLIGTYGDNVFKLLEHFNKKEYLKKLNNQYPYLLAELYYGVNYEYVKKPTDFLFRRLDVGKIDIKAALKMLSTVTDTMGDILHWSNEQRLEEYKSALKEMNELLQTIQ